MIYIFYHIGHIGDTFHTQRIIQNIVHCNPDKEILFYSPNNQFIQNDISNNMLEKNEDTKHIIDTIEQIHKNPYTLVVKIDNTVLIQTGINKLINHGYGVIEMNPISYQEEIIKYLEDMNKNCDFDFNYVPLSPLELLPKIPATNIDSFSKWRKVNTQPLLFYYNYLPKSTQHTSCMSEEEHMSVILHILSINPEYTVLVPKYDGSNPRIICCKSKFNCIESITCENVYKLTKIQQLCDYSVHFDIGACMTYMNRDFFTRRNTILHFNVYGSGYTDTLMEVLQKVKVDNNVHAITCKNSSEMIEYFSKNSLRSWKLLQRTQGYGSSFNNLYLLEDKIKKEAKTSYGITKIKKEIIFYKYVQKHDCLPMPTFLEESGISYIMKYLPDYKPLFHLFPHFSENIKADILQQIQIYLERLHQTETRIISHEIYKKAIYAEMIDKLKKRYEEVKDIINEYSFIKSVNGVLVRTFQENLNLLQKAATKFIENRNEYIFTPIHGDCQFNNILYNEQTDDIIFIDPRGYFGDHDLFGLPEYDFAKVKFALSGYDAFDAKDVTELTIRNNNIMLEIPTLIPEPLAKEKDDFISQLVVSIWMGNAHCFKENKFKTVYSYFIGAYYASLHL
jgi:hypothetical protein